ncbi:hypothetical protein MVES1_003621 [Malassezia vespertilionis]|uniref:uncharacterized protein n=1 Tax=Malassezia vespertilionis TaxID=2020962 RepID=UPI0024B210B6|nr:uncharacterized protein MVES1_003621 [Malassezia vespertilionis]WFD08249.1 hypothetical protein MVES1_003621 [Malassezia vespertilionis]
MAEHDPSVTDGASATDASKLKTLLSILKRTVGVKDLASLRISLPAYMMEPIPNLEYWNYQDRADFFVTVGDYEDPMDRMLAMVRYAVTKELKFVHGKVVKPYNSILGEHFRCHWDVEPLRTDASGGFVPHQSVGNTKPPTHLELVTKQPQDHDGCKKRVVYVTEQVSHHPPVSFYYYACPDAGLEMTGVDQLSAKFTGTAMRIFSGEKNQGVFVKLTYGVRAKSAVGEEYHLTHPAGAIFGLFRGSFWPAVTDTATITCTPAPSANGAKPVYLRALLEYVEEGWLSKPKYAVEGVVYAYEPDHASASYTSVRKVPSDHLEPCERKVRPLEQQDELESRRIWSGVTKAILEKEYSRATNVKIDLEQQQRDQAKARAEAGTNFVPRYFEDGIENGKPKLTAAGKAAVLDELRRDNSKDMPLPTKN